MSRKLRGQRISINDSTIFGSILRHSDLRSLDLCKCLPNIGAQLLRRSYLARRGIELGTQKTRPLVGTSPSYADFAIFGARLLDPCRQVVKLPVTTATGRHTGDPLLTLRGDDLRHETPSVRASARF